MLQNTDGLRDHQRRGVLPEDDGQLHHQPGKADSRVHRAAESPSSRDLSCLLPRLSAWWPGWSFYPCFRKNTIISVVVVAEVVEEEVEVVVVVEEVVVAVDMAV